MRALVRWSVRNRVAANILMVVLLVGGLFALMRMRREMFPEFSLGMINITVPYPGAAPEEVEEGINIKIEEKIHSIDGVRKIYSTAQEGRGLITVELRSDVRDAQKVLDEIKSEIDRIETFPEEAEEPVITEFTFRDPAIRVALFGEADEDVLRRLGEKVRDEIAALPVVSQVDLAGVREREISVEVAEEELRAYGLTLEAVAEAVRRGSLDLPAGTIKAEGSEILIRAKGQRYTGREFEGIPLLTLPDGTVIRLGQVARVTEGFQDVDLEARFQGKPAVTIGVYKTGSEDILEITEAVKDYVARKRSELPPQIGIATYGDFSVMVQGRIRLLVNNGIMGFFLVAGALWLFLELRLAFWVAMGIPVSMLGAMILLVGTDQTINMISLFAFIMTLGIVVDDATVVGENVWRHRGMKKSPEDAVTDGAVEVGGPVVMSVLTTIVAFVPMLFVSGIMGKFIAVMPFAVIIILAFSLFEALLILPAHLAQTLENPARTGRLGRRLRGRIDRGIEWFIQKLYRPVLIRAAVNRYFTMSLAGAMLIASVGLIAGGRVPFVIFPKSDSDFVIAKVTFPEGTPAAVTGAAVSRLEAALDKVNTKLTPPGAGPEEHFVQRVYSSIGQPAFDDKSGPLALGGNVGGLYLELLGSERRTVTSDEFLKLWRAEVGEIAGAEEVTFQVPEGGPPGNPIEVQLIGDDLPTLELAAEAFKAKIREFAGTFDVTDDFRPGKPEIRVEARPEAYPLGVTQQDLARRVRGSYYGIEAVRIQRGRDDIKVMVRYPEEERRTLASLDEIRIRTAAGAEVPFSEVAEVSPGRAYSQIRRVDRRRVINVTSDLDENVANAREIIQALQRDYVPRFREQFPTVDVSFEGQEQQTRESVGSLINGFAYAALVMFALLAIQFRSYWQPVIIMVAIPIGIVGAIVGHLIMGLPITLMSLFGFVALAGIVVNDSIVLISFINNAVEEGMAPFEAAVQSGLQRFRAVILTSTTTIAGLLPIAFEKDFQAQFIIPMAVSISFGLLFATVLVLLVVPALYLIVYDVQYLHRFLSGKAQAKV